MKRLLFAAFISLIVISVSAQQPNMQDREHQIYGLTKRCYEVAEYKDKKLLKEFLKELMALQKGEELWTTLAICSALYFDEVPPTVGIGQIKPRAKKLLKHLGIKEPVLKEKAKK